MKMIYALPMAAVAAMAISGCSHKSNTDVSTTPAANKSSMMAPAPAMSAHPDAMPAAPMSSSAGSSDSMSSEPDSSGSAN